MAHLSKLITCYFHHLYTLYHPSTLPAPLHPSSLNHDVFAKQHNRWDHAQTYNPHLPSQDGESTQETEALDHVASFQCQEAQATRGSTLRSAQPSRAGNRGELGAESAEWK